MPNNEHFVIMNVFFPCRTLQTVGPSHARTYTVAVYFKGERIGCGKGPRYEEETLVSLSVCLCSGKSPPGISKLCSLYYTIRMWSVCNYSKMNPRSNVSSKPTVILGNQPWTRCAAIRGLALWREVHLWLHMSVLSRFGYAWGVMVWMTQPLDVSFPATLALGILTIF